MGLIPHILIDRNVVDWVTERPGLTKPTRWDLPKELDAYRELEKLRKQGKICMTVLGEHLEGHFSPGTPEDSKKKVSEWLENEISTRIFLLAPPESSGVSKWFSDVVAYFYEIVGEKQDDPALFLYVYILHPDITHFFTMDDKFSKKQEGYLNTLKTDLSIWHDIQFRRNGNYGSPERPLFIGLPREILRDVSREFAAKSV